MNKQILNIDKVMVLSLIFFLFIESIPTVELNVFCFLVPLLITGTIRSIVVLMVLIMQVISIANEKRKKVFKRNKNPDHS